MNDKIKLILGKLFTGSEHLGDVYFLEAENEILSLFDKEIIGKDEILKLKDGLSKEMITFETTKIALRNELRKEQRNKLRLIR